MRTVKKTRPAVLLCIAAVLLSLAMVLPAPVAAKPKSDEGLTVVVGTNPEYPPFEMLKNGKIVGFDIDLVMAIGERAGFTVEFRSYPFADLVTPPGVWTSCGMVASALTPSEDRKQFMDFSDLYFDSPPYGPLAFAFPKGSALREVVNTALPQVKDDGTYAKIFKSWFVPKVATLKPASAKRSATVTISGSEFGAQRSTSHVKFGATKCTKYVSWSDAQIKCRVPATAKFGKQTVTVTTTVGTSNALSFKVKR
jgi:ABC-type amino acid transport substrate-binding protein